MPESQDSKSATFKRQSLNKDSCERERESQVRSQVAPESRIVRKEELCTLETVAHRRPPIDASVRQPSPSNFALFRIISIERVASLMFSAHWLM